MAITEPTIGAPAWGPVLNQALTDLDNVNTTQTANISANQTSINSALASITAIQANLPATSTVQVPAPTGNASTDKANINAAIASLPAGGGVVKLQAGTYLIPIPANPSDGGISMSVNNSALVGAGVGVTVLKMVGGTTDCTGIVRTPSGVSNSKITIKDLSIDGNAAGQSSNIIIGFFCGVTPNNTATDTDISCINVEIYGCTGYGFDPHERTTRLTLAYCVSHDNGTDGAHDGFTLDGQYDGTIVGCVAYNNGRHGFNFVTASTRMTVLGCRAYGNTSNGFTTQNGSKYIDLVGCTANNNTAAGFVVNGVPQTGQQDNTPGGMNTLSACYAVTNGTHGYQLVGSSSNKLSGCHAQDNSAAATNTSYHYRIAESGSSFSTNNTLTACTWGQTAGVTNAAKNGISEQTASDGPNYILGSSGSGTVGASLALVNSVSLLVAAHNGTSGTHPATTSYTEEAPNEHGLLEWNGQAKYAGLSVGAMVAGQLQLAKFITQTGQTLSTVSIAFRGTVPAGCANSFVGLYDSQGNLLSTSADQSSAWNGASNGVKTVTLLTPQTPAVGSTIFVAILVGSATTLPTLGGFSVSGAAISGVGLGNNFTNPQRFGLSTATGLTALPSTFTFTSNSATTFWVGLS